MLSIKHIGKFKVVHQVETQMGLRFTIIFLIVCLVKNYILLKYIKLTLHTMTKIQMMIPMMIRTTMIRPMMIRMMSRR